MAMAMHGANTTMQLCCRSLTHVQGGDGNRGKSAFLYYPWTTWQRPFFTTASRIWHPSSSQPRQPPWAAHGEGLCILSSINPREFGESLGKRHFLYTHLILMACGIEVGSFTGPLYSLDSEPPIQAMMSSCAAFLHSLKRNIWLEVTLPMLQAHLAERSLLCNYLRQRCLLQSSPFWPGSGEALVVF